MKILRITTKYAFAPMIIGALLLISPTVKAQEQPIPGTGQALEIAPTIVNLDVDPGETVDVEIQLRNVSNEELIVTGEINDFLASDEQGSPNIIMDDDDGEFEDNPFSMRAWAQPIQPLLLEPGEIETLTAPFIVPDNASPGGYYGAVRFTGTPPELEGTGVSLTTSIGTLLLATVSGETDRNAAIEEFKVEQDGSSGSFFESTPLQLVQRIQNTGNVHIQPTGQVRITDMFDRRVASANVNLGQQNILPESIRRFEQDIDSSLIGDRRLFGRYTAELELEYGEDKILTDTLTFWVVPYRLIAAIVVAFVILLLAIRYALKRYKQKIIKQTRRR